MNEYNCNIQLADLHCHLLPGMDDGAYDIQEAVDLVSAQYKSGVRQIALTSHFNYERMTLKSFVEHRALAYMRMLAVLEEVPFEIDEIKFQLGAEVFFSPNLFHEDDILALCIENTRILLLELPTDMMPPYFDETIYQIQSYNITPVIAHVERYPYVMDNLPILCDWEDRGIYAQINAGTILKGGRQAKLCLDLLRWNLAHIIASDAHSIAHRPPNLSDGINAVRVHLGEQIANRLISNADLLFKGICPEIGSIYCPRKILGRWR